MKTKTKLILVIIFLIIAVLFGIWGWHVYLDYPGMREMHKAARNSASLQYFVAIGSALFAYVLTFKWKK